MDEPLEKPRAERTPAQKANIVKARVVKKDMDEATRTRKEQERLERRFDKLIELFDVVQLPKPEVQEVIKSKKVKKPPAPPETSSSEDEPEPVKVEKPKPRVQVSQDKRVVLKFC